MRFQISFINVTNLHLLFLTRPWPGASSLPANKLYVSASIAIARLRRLKHSFTACRLINYA
jgi:hypothetical protein